jgi:hypothetical protein
MDMLRSCYSTKAKFRGNDTLETMVWYFAPEGALPFPQSHVFGSLNWVQKPATPLSFGEQPGQPRPWRDGSAPFPTRGTNFCGSVTLYHTNSTLLPADKPRRCDDSYLCCANDGCYPQWHAYNILPGQLFIHRGTVGTIAALNSNLDDTWSGTSPEGYVWTWSVAPNGNY